MFFPVVTYGCESWTIKEAEHWRIDAFELWSWRLLRVPWTAERSNQSILKQINLNSHWTICWSWNSNTFATWCEVLTHWKRLWCWERLKLKEKRTTEEKMVGWHHQLDGHGFEQAPAVDDGHGHLAVLQSMRSHYWTRLNNWTELMLILIFNPLKV